MSDTNAEIVLHSIGEVPEVIVEVFRNGITLVSYEAEDETCVSLTYEQATHLAEIIGRRSRVTQVYYFDSEPNIHD